MVASLNEAMRDAQRAKACCAACVFWRAREPHHLKGECRRFPPQVIVRTTPPNHWDASRGNWEQRPEHYFPMSNHDYWCGEYEELPE